MRFAGKVDLLKQLCLWFSGFRPAVFKLCGRIPMQVALPDHSPHPPTPSDRVRRGFALSNQGSPGAPSIPAGFRAARAQRDFSRPVFVSSAYQESDSFLPCRFFRKNVPWRGRGRSPMRRAQADGRGVARARSSYAEATSLERAVFVIRRDSPHLSHGLSMIGHEQEFVLRVVADEAGGILPCFLDFSRKPASAKIFVRKPARTCRLVQPGLIHERARAE